MSWANQPFPYPRTAFNPEVVKDMDHLQIFWYGGLVVCKCGNIIQRPDFEEFWSCCCLICGTELVNEIPPY